MFCPFFPVHQKLPKASQVCEFTSSGVYCAVVRAGAKMPCCQTIENKPKSQWFAFATRAQNLCDARKAAFELHGYN
eukprot:8141596-Lingulodinium_polyedra.AAC.1